MIAANQLIISCYDPKYIPGALMSFLWYGMQESEVKRLSMLKSLNKITSFKTKKSENRKKRILFVCATRDFLKNKLSEVKGN